MTRRLDIAALRLNTEITGEVNAVQVKSVAAWPKFAFTELKSHETQINPDTREVTYLLKLKPKKNIKDFQGFRIIEESVWALLGDGWRTTFKLGERILYAGSRRKEVRNDANTIDLGKDLSGFDPKRAGSVPKVR